MYLILVYKSDHVLKHFGHFLHQICKKYVNKHITHIQL